MKARKVKGLDPERSLKRNARRIVATRIEELRGLADEALDPGREIAQHDMRIAAKRLRYVLEVVGPCVGGEEAEEARKAAARLQGALGDIHDCDVMAPRLSGSGDAEAALRARRERHHGRFCGVWLDERVQGALNALETRIG